MAAGVIPAAPVLPGGGGWGDQAAVMVDAFDILSAADAALESGE